MSTRFAVPSVGADRARFAGRLGALVLLAAATCCGAEMGPPAAIPLPAPKNAPPAAATAGTPASAGAAAAAAPAAPAPAAPAPAAPQAAEPRAGQPEAAEQEKRIGRVIRIGLPITGPSASRIRQFVLNALDTADTLGARPVLIFQFEVPPDQVEFAGRSEFGPCYELADFLSSERLSKATTVAFVPQSIQGHAVLVALACEQIFMAPDAEIGDAGVHQRQVTPPVLSAYKEIAERHVKIPPEVAMKLVDSSRKVLRVETEVGPPSYVSPQGLEELRKKHTVAPNPQVLFEAGQPARLTGREARKLDLIDQLAGNLPEVTRALDLPSAAVEEETLLGGHWKAVRVDLKGPIQAGKVSQVQKLIADAIRRDQVNFVCLWIDSAGGSPADSLRLATYLAADLDRSEVRTVAYVPDRARCDAALVALACDQVVMHPQATLGGEGDYVFTEDDIAQIRKTLRDTIALKKARSWSLPAAMIDPKLEVFRCTRRGGKYTEYFCEEELAKQPDAAQWEKGPAVTRPGRPLEVDGRQAVEYGLANETATSFAEFRQLYGLENDPALLEPSWVDQLVEALASPYVAVLLLMIGGAALYGELHAPGIGVGGFLAAVCFVLFFWSRFLGGTADWLEVILFLLGVGCVMLEIFVLPGFGIFGLGGGALILASLVLASQSFILPRNSYQFGELQQSLAVLAAAGAGIIAAAMLLNRWLPHTPILGQILLQPPTPEETEARTRRGALAAFDASLVGEEGTTVTPLLPSGKARFGNQLLDVVTEDGDSIEPGVRVRVTEVRGSRILVRPAQEPQ